MERERRSSILHPPSSGRSVRNFVHLQWIQTLQKLLRLLAVEFWIGRFDAEEKAVATGKLEVRRVEDGMMRHRQSIQDQHSQQRRQRCDQYRQFKGHRNERGSAVERTATHVHWIIDRV